MRNGFRDCQEFWETVLGTVRNCKKTVLEFAFPFGTYNFELVNYCKQIGFTKIALLNYNTTADKADDLLSDRIVMNPHINLKLQLIYLLKGRYI